MKIKIIGAGSIGNHLSNASRSMGWDVTLVDIDSAALERTKNDIYPSRYGKWDDGITLVEANNAPVGGFDMIFIGTPPDSHVPLALKALEESPRLLLVEKPFCPPSMDGVDKLVEKSTENNIPIYVGFDHAVGTSLQKVKEIIDSGVLGKIITHDVEFREHWRGIFNAHPWLAGPHDSYLGFWERGGGASSEHSHALHLWLTLAEIIGVGRVEEVGAAIEYVKNDTVDYDSIFSLNLQTESGAIGRVIQDVITLPTRKYARIQGENGVVEWWNNFNSEGDAVFHYDADGNKSEYFIKKTRPDDFITELTHIKDIIDGKAQYENSPIRMELGVETARIVAAAHQAVAEKRIVNLDKVRTRAAKVTN